MERDTAIGGPGGRFPATRLSVIDSLRSDDADTRRLAGERLVSLYWKPLYKYVRIKWNRSNEDAKDLIQGFFALALERETLASFDPQRAGFRTFLRLLLDRYASNELKGAARLKRGGDAVTLDFDAAESELARVASSRPDPEELLHAGSGSGACSARRSSASAQSSASRGARSSSSCSRRSISKTARRGPRIARSRRRSESRRRPSRTTSRPRDDAFARSSSRPCAR